MKQPKKITGNQTQQENANRQRKAKITVETLLVIAAILIIPLFFAIRSGANSPAVQGTSTIAPQPTPASATAAQTNAKEPPACTFPLAQTTTAEAAPHEYVLSGPNVALTADANIGIVEWLPDSQQVLMTQDSRINNQQTIEIFDTQTGNIQVYATRTRISQSPSWLPELKAVIYPVMNILKVDNANHRYEFTHQVRLSLGDPNSTQLVADNLSDFSIVVKPDKSQIGYLSNGRLIKQNSLLRGAQSVAFDPTKWEYRRSIYQPVPYQMDWRPSTSQVFLYSKGDAGGYTFLLDADTGEICEINFGSKDQAPGWTEVAHWSPNGRYLAGVRTWGMLPVHSSDLAVLDVETGKLYAMTLPSSNGKSPQFVNDIAWAPDSQHLAAIGQTLSENQNLLGGLYLADFLSGDSSLVPSDQNLGSGLGDINLIWSQDGSQLMVKCPTNQEDRLCLFSVHERIQP